MSTRCPVSLERPHQAETLPSGLLSSRLLPTVVEAPGCGCSWSPTSQPILTFVLACFLSFLLIY